MNRYLRLSILAAMAVAVVSCTESDDGENTCQDGAKQCGGGGIPQVCENGAWVNLAACSGGQYCGDNGECIGLMLVCPNGSKQCSRLGIPQTCVNETWSDLDACASGQTCSAGECIAGGACQNGAKQCGNYGIPQLCANDVWTDLAACSNGQLCSAGDCIQGSACQNGAKQCSSYGVPQQCASGTWTDQAACTGGKTCSAGTCVAGSTCQNGAKQCTSSGIPQLCSGGAWTNQSACTSGKTCSAGTCVAGSTCQNGAQQCSSSGVPQLCSGGAWTNQAACTGGKTCSAGTCVGGSSGVGSSCDASFVESCQSNSAYYCADNKVAALNCAESGLTCIILGNKTADCGFPNANEYCSAQGDIFFYGDGSGGNAFCNYYASHGVVLFGACHLIDGVMYGVQSYAESVCYEKNRLFCTGNTIYQQKCTSSCSFDGWEATCH